MKISKVTYKHSNDFKADFECEWCGYSENEWGYNDHYFHSKVIPNMKCKKCDKSSKEIESTSSPYVELFSNVFGPEK